MQYNYTNNNCIPELFMDHSVVVDGEFLLEWCEYLVNHKCGTSVMYQFEPLIWGVKMLHMFYTSFIAAASDQMVDLWTCSKHVQRKKSDLCEIDIVMSSLRDIGEEML